MTEEGNPGAPRSAKTPSSQAETRTSTDALRLLPQGTLVAGRYRILGMLGIGGMGVVFRAKDEELGMEIALKTMRPESAEDPRLLERFRNELVLARQVTHRNVVRIHDIGVHEGLAFITMDFVPGRSLREVLEQEGPLELERAKAIFRQLVGAAGEAHHKGVLHQDLKPANILLNEAGEAFITDFGIARSLGSVGPSLADPAQPGRQGLIVGTPDYLSPEQARGEAVDARSDIFALGIILFEMLSGQLPFPGGTYAETIGQRISGNPRTLQEVGVDVPRQIQGTISRCLERNRNRRYPNAQGLLEDLDRPPATWSFPKKLLWAGLLASVLVGGWVGVRAYRSRSSSAGAQARHMNVAVLPFVEETNQPDLAWTARGVPELVAAALAESPSLGVVDSMRVFRTLDDLQLQPGALGPRELKQLGELLDADRIISGRIRILDGRLRLDVSLATPGSDAPVANAISAHAESQGAEGLTGLVAALSGEIRRGLEVAAPKGRVAPLRVSAVALQNYSAGVAQLLKGDSLLATPSLEKAVAEAPGFTAAWVRLTEAYERQGLDDKALEAAQRAVATLGTASGRVAYEARARKAMLVGDPEGATKVLREMVRLYPNDAEGRIAMAQAYADQGKMGPATATLQDVVKADPNHPRAWFDLAKYTVMAGDPRRAVDDYLVRALVIQSKLRNEQGQADILNAFGVAYQQMGDLDLATDNYEKAATLRKRIGDARGTATSLKNLATVQMIRGEYQKALTSLRSALQILEEIGNRSGIAELQDAFGSLEEEQGKYAEALTHYRAGLQVRRTLGDQRSLAKSHNNVGYTYYLLSDYENAMVYFQEALRLYRAGGDPTGGMLVTQSIGLVQLAQGPWDAAVKSFLETLGESRDQDSKSAMAMSQGYLGLAEQYQGRYGAAILSFDKALGVLESLRDERGVAEFSLLKAGTLVEMGMLPEAEKLLSEVERRLGAKMNHEQRATFLILRGELQLGRSSPREGKLSFAGAIREAEASHGINRVLAARLGLGRALAAAGDLAGAIKQIQSVQREADRLGELLLRLRSAETMAVSELAKGNLAAAEAGVRGGLRVLVSTGSYSGAFRLHLLLAKILDRRGDKPGSGRALDQARLLCAKVKEGMDASQQSAFGRTAEVRELDGLVRTSKAIPEVKGE